MRNFIIMIISYSITGLAMASLFKLMLKRTTVEIDKYFNEKFDGLNAKDIILDQDIAKRLEIICKTERRQRSDQINLILDQWLTEYEKEHGI